MVTFEIVSEMRCAFDSVTLFRLGFVSRVAGVLVRVASEYHES